MDNLIAGGAQAVSGDSGVRGNDEAQDAERNTEAGQTAQVGSGTD
jgi:hypothetical protein